MYLNELYTSCSWIERLVLDDVSFSEFERFFGAEYASGAHAILRN